MEDGDIDIISIGTLYSGGRWDNKYWTSNRARDRHPYPVGYQAARTYNGVRSTMQIRQGNTGPLFLISSSTHGLTTSGPTPDIAWKNFQRACSPLVRRKRLSPSIDGAQFFGFKYPMVQQLLRQLVVTAASRGTSLSNPPQQNKLLPNTFDLPKRGEKRKMNRTQSITRPKPKKHRPLKDTHNADIREYFKRPSTAATENVTKPHPTERQAGDDDKFWASLPVDMLKDPPSTPVRENLFSSHEASYDALTTEVSPTNLSRDADPTIHSLENDCDSASEDVTMSMMKILLPQAVPLLRKARRMKKKTADANSLDGVKNNSICQDHDKTKHALGSSKDIIPDSFDINSDQQKDLEKLPDVPDSCDELDDNACGRGSCDELNNAYVPDSCDELETDAYVPDSCDELDNNACVPDSFDQLDNNAYALDSGDERGDNGCNNAYVPGSCDALDDSFYVPDLCGEPDKNSYVPDSCVELDENAQVPDSCDELDDKEIVQDSPKQLNENLYVSDSSDALDENYYAPDSCDDSDETENVPTTRLLTDVDFGKAMQESTVQVCEGKSVTCTCDSGEIISTKPMDVNEGTKETLSLGISSKDGGCGTRFGEYEGISKDNLKQQGRFKMASQQQIQNTNQTSHMRMANVSTDGLHGGTCPVFSNGCQIASDKCVSGAYVNAVSNRASVANHNPYEKVVKRYDYGCSENNDGQCREAITMPADVPQSTSVLHDKTPTSGSNEHFAGTQKPTASDVVNKGQFFPSDENVSSMPETLHLEQSARADDNIERVGRIAYDSDYPKLRISKEPEKKLNGFGKLIGLPSYNKELLTREKNVCSTPQTLILKQSASINDSGTSAGRRTIDGHCSKLSTATEIENRSSIGNFEEFIDWDRVTDEELLMCDKMASSLLETLHHKQLTSVDDSNKLTGCKAFDGNKSVLITATERENKLNGFGKLIGCYEHPKPVLSVLLYSKGNETYICTSCGNLQDNQRTLFMYNLKVEGTSAGRPFFVGHSLMLLPDPKCFGRQIALDKSGMQFTPNGQNLVLLNGMQLPSCRNRSVQCRCLECQSRSCEENAVKIVQLNNGFATVLAKLKTVHRVLCLLVCEPNYLVAVEANGAFRFWTMNSTWRYMKKEFILPPSDCISPCAIELKQIPNCPHLVVGHNCLGWFGLWDISRHAIISRFFIPDTAVFGIIPLSLYEKNRKDNTFNCPNTVELPNNLKSTAMLWSSHRTKNTKLNFSGEKDVVIPILVATFPGLKSSYRQMPDGCWKFALLMNNTVVLSHTLDARAVTVAASGDCGVLGMNQGYLHVLNLSTRLELGASLCFKDGRVQSLCTDNTRSGLLAVADDNGKLLLYLRGQER